MSLSRVMASIAVASGLFLSPLATADEATYAINVAGGKVSQQTGIEPWQRLRSFQTRLRELLHVPEGENLQVADVGCLATAGGGAQVECGDLDPECDAGGKSCKPKGNAKKLTAVKYIVFVKDKERLAPIFREALVTVKGDPLLDDVGFIMTEVEVGGGPDCGGYPSPCNPRPVCTQYNGCSRSQYSCQKCY